MNVAIIDSGIDLYKLYNGARHNYEATWLKIETLKSTSLCEFDLIIIPAGTDNSLLLLCRQQLHDFMRRGGWVFSFDGIADSVLESTHWRHTPTNYKKQQFSIAESKFAYLLDGVDLLGLASKEGVRGWWCEGELFGEKLIPLIVDQESRIITAVNKFEDSPGGLIATAAGRLPTFSADTTLAPNVLFMNLLKFVRSNLVRARPAAKEIHVYLHSGNWAHRSFVASLEFKDIFTALHWSDLNNDYFKGAKSIWIPWESNTRALKEIWPILQTYISTGTTLVIEDLRDDWLPGIKWFSRPVDSSWWRENRELDIIISADTQKILSSLSARSLKWHYHGVFDGPPGSVPLLTNSEGHCILSLVLPHDNTAGKILVSTLDATFEYGAGKIKETADYIHSVLSYIVQPAAYYKKD